MLNSKIQEILDKEYKRQEETLDLIASENFTSKAVREAVGSIFMHKYSEGYPGERYYEGNENIDELERLCILMVKKVFKAPQNWEVNVQPWGGSNANLAVYNALLNPGDKILSMYLPDGGHLSHGWSIKSKNEEKDEGMIYRGGNKKVNIVSKFFNVIQYKTDPETNLLDYNFINQLAKIEKPRLIVTGGTAYPRNIDYKKMKQIASEVGAYYLCDVAHEAGLIAADVIESPIGIADVVTFTTHKVMRGPKGAVIMCKNELISSINKSIIPGLQGGPHNGTIAGILQAMFEVDTNEYRDYAKQVLLNAKILSEELKKYNFTLVSGGTDKHLVLINLKNKNIGGKFAARALNYANIVTNMNTIPYETRTPLNPSGLRIGSPTITTRGMKEEEVKPIVKWINEVINIACLYSNLKFDEFEIEIRNNKDILKIKNEVIKLCNEFPLHQI